MFGFLFAVAVCGADPADNLGRVVAELRNQDSAFALTIQAYREIQTFRVERDYEARLKASASHNQPAAASDQTTQLIRRVRQATRKRYTAEEKIRIVMEGIRGDDPISTICRREGIHAKMHYKWLSVALSVGPYAIVNGQLVTLNKIVTHNTGN